MKRSIFHLGLTTAVLSLALFVAQDIDARGRGGGGGGRGGGGGGGAVQPGTYRVTMVANGTTYTSSITVRPDPMLAEINR